MAEEVGDEITVTGRKGGALTNHRIPLDFGGSGQNPPLDFNDLLPNALREVLQVDTDFDVDGRFTSTQKTIITQVIHALATHPRFAAKMDVFLGKSVDVNISAATRSDQILPQDNGALYGKNGDGTVSNGATLDIYPNAKCWRSTI